MGEKGKPCRRKAGFKDAVRRASIDSAHLRERCGACDVLELRADRLGGRLLANGQAHARSTLRERADEQALSGRRC
ncbi:hypothetical protein NUH86_21960 [Sphingobium sp. JS3065]|uniref:hypothetical protein n=1 Tax=Sphingobium sp. JS3065 TaxID=2970925 RepID=UPI00226489D0|nr:hypothetical protein [Sphingobium sp. JS3065]UZW57373.1 hypothetical protein NUH86_21960 [Sphingobium sp. JS3065]